MIRLIKVTAVDDSAARLVPHHLMRPFFVRHARTLNQASSVAMMINIAEASNSNIEQPFRYHAIKVGEDRSQSSAGAPAGAPTETLQPEKCEAVSTTSMFRYSGNVLAPTVAKA